MSESSSARVDLARKIRNGEYTLTQAEAELDRMEKCYGESAFLAGSVIRKEPPWTMDDLENLNMEVTAGAGSRELLHYMAEVSDAVYNKKRRTKTLAIVGGILAAAALIGAIAVIVHQQTEIAYQQAEIAQIKNTVSVLQQQLQQLQQKQPSV